MGLNLSYGKAMGIYGVSMWGRYIPGKVWSVAGRVYFSREERLPAKDVTASIVLETLILAASAGILFLLLLPKLGLMGYSWLYYLIVFFLVFLSVYPKIIFSVFNFFLKKMHLSPVRTDIPFCYIITVLFLFLLNWLFQGVYLAFIAESFIPDALSNMFTYVGVNAVSWFTGYIAFFAPGGIGVREGIMTLLLRPVLCDPQPVLLSFAARFVGTIVEVCFAGIITAVFFMNKRRQR